MAVDPYHRYSNESEKANQDIYDDFILNKTPLVSMIYIKSIKRSKGSTVSLALYPLSYLKFSPS